MKKTVLSILFAFAAMATFAQDKAQPQEMRTIFGGQNDRIAHGGYGALNVEYGQIDGKDAVLVGGRGGWIINHRLVLGLGGKGIASTVSYPYEDAGSLFNEKYYLNGGYGGFLIEPIIAPFSPVHVSFPVLIGGGGVAYSLQYKYQNNWDNSYWETIDASAFFVVEPGMEINLNLVKFMRISFGGYYRFTSGLALEDPFGEKAPKDLIDGFSAGVSLKFGKF
ncbi:MAG: hypothetical protein K9H16_12165 [Bacteroidales bacterium]|nr:hypothetical protein [Bacteroidales bacterium]